MSNEKIIKVRNRDNGHVGYVIPDLNLRRDFNAGEIKEISLEELQKLAYLPGGQALIRNYLLIEDEEAVDSIIGNVEPEYYYTEEDVKNLLLNGSLDELKDCIDYAPSGVLDLIKKYAVELKINDIAKRDAIKEMLGFNVTNAIMINEETEEKEEVKEKTRRVAPASEKSSSTGRRVIIKDKNN